MVGDVDVVLWLANVRVQQETGNMNSGVGSEGAASEGAEALCGRQLEEEGGIFEVHRHDGLLDGVVWSRVVNNLGKDLVEQLSIHCMDLSWT